MYAVNENTSQRVGPKRRHHDYSVRRVERLLVLCLNIL